MKQCNVFGKKEGKSFKIKFTFANEDYIERLDTELTKANVMLEDVSRLYIQDVK
jgi:hypothetical protein